MSIDTTLQYYDENASTFLKDTIAADVHVLQDWFLGYVGLSGKILDLGCGSGRDSTYFKSLDYDVEAVDGSAEMCKAASELTGLPVRQLLFSELDYIEKFDGIWACASLLHVSMDELPIILRLVVRAMKPGGVLYASFKYGTFSGDRNGRYYTDLTENTLTLLTSKVPDLSIIDTRITSDVRPGRDNEKWINALLKVW